MRPWVKAGDCRDQACLRRKLRPTSHDSYDEPDTFYKRNIDISNLPVMSMKCEALRLPVMKREALCLPVMKREALPLPVVDVEQLLQDCYYCEANR